MRFNFVGAILKDFPKDGPILVEDKPLTIKNMLLMALLQGPPIQEAPGVKLEKYKLAHQIMALDVVTLTAEEIAMLKASVSAITGPLIYGQISDFFDNPQSTVLSVAAGD